MGEKRAKLCIVSPSTKVLAPTTFASSLESNCTRDQSKTHLYIFVLKSLYIETNRWNSLNCLVTFIL